MFVHLLYVDAHGRPHALCEYEDGRLMACEAFHITFKDPPQFNSAVEKPRAHSGRWPTLKNFLSFVRR